MIYLYNELASLREELSELKGGKGTARLGHTTEVRDLKVASERKIADRALARTHGVVHVFSICPAPELMLTTTEFWKTKEAGKAFHFMYEVTKNELKRFTHLVSSNQIRMALVSPVAPEVPNDETRRSDLTPNANSYFDNTKPIYKSTGLVDYQVTYFKDF